MNIETLKSIKMPSIKSQHMVTGLAGVFALVSVQNIAHFFIHLDHPFIASWTLGIAIGCALVILAHLLSEIDMRERKAFLGLLSVTLILVTLSGLIQGVEYSHKLGFIGYVLAFVLAATGEIVLPLAHSWHNEAKRRQAVNDAGQRVEEIAADTMIKVMASTDTAKAQRAAEKQIEKLIVAHVGSTVRKLMPKDVQTQTSEIPDISTERGPVSPINGVVGKPVSELNAIRLSRADQRRAEILAAVAGQDVFEFANEQAEKYGVKRRTIQDDIRKLEQNGDVIANGVIVRTQNEPATIS